MYILLILALIVMIFLSYVLFNRELLCPPVIVPAVFLMCTCIGLIRYKDWNIAEYSAKSVGLILLGFGSFLVFSWIAYYSGNNKNRYFQSSRNTIRKAKRIEISYGILLAMIAVGVLANIFMFQFIKNISFSLGRTESSFSSLVNTYYKYKYSPDATALSGIKRAFSVISNLDAVICLYIFLYNLVLRYFRKKDFLLLSVVALWIVYAMLNSNRNEVLTFFAKAVYLIYFFWNIYYGWNRGINGRIIRLGIFAFIILITLFVPLATVIGRRQTWSISSVRDYLTIYISSGIRNFDLFVQDYKPSEFFGKETLFSIHRFLYNRFGIGASYSVPLEFRAINDVSIGNIYTALRRYYADFGVTGIIVFPGVMGFFFTRFFMMIKKECMTGNIGCSALLFSYLCEGLFYFPIEEQFIRTHFAIMEIVKIILLYFMYKALIEKRCRIRVYRLQVCR